MRDSQGGFTLVELLVVVNILAILFGVATIVSGEYGNEAKCMEIHNVLPQIIRAQAYYCMTHNGYFTAGHDELKNYGVDLAETRYFRYSTFTNDFSSFSVRAEATAWVEGGWVLYNQRGDPVWCCDGVQIQKSWLPN
jgi:prepilin-type N-terminal cleavage/methylation domain-containing protein